MARWTTVDPNRRRRAYRPHLGGHGRQWRGGCDGSRKGQPIVLEWAARRDSPGNLTWEYIPQGCVSTVRVSPVCVPTLRVSPICVTPLRVLGIPDILVPVEPTFSNWGISSLDVQGLPTFSPRAVSFPSPSILCQPGGAYVWSPTRRLRTHRRSLAWPQTRARRIPADNRDDGKPVQGVTRVRRRGGWRQRVDCQLR